MHDGMDKIVAAVAGACALAEDIAGGYARGTPPPLFQGIGPSKPRVPAVEGTTEAEYRASSLWLVLRQLLRLDGSDNNFSYHKAAAAVLLKEMPTSTIPEWLEDSFLGKSRVPDTPADANAYPPPQSGVLLAPWKVFTPRKGINDGSGANPTAMLNLYVFAGRLEEACRFLSRLLDAKEVTDIDALVRLVPERSGGTDWLPYSAIDRLFALCEASLARAEPSSLSVLGAKGRSMERRAALAEAFEVAQERLVEYFKIAKAVTEQASANRAVAATMETAGPFSASMITD